jgi:hypothetical protein
MIHLINRDENDACDEMMMMRFLSLNINVDGVLLLHKLWSEALEGEQTGETTMTIE